MAAIWSKTTLTPEIVIETVSGDISIRGWDRQEITVSADPDDVELQPGEMTPAGEAAVVRLRLHDDAALQVPADSSLRIERISGDLSLGGVGGAVYLGTIEGDASIRSTGALTIAAVEGDLSARGVQGDCRIGRVEGDAAVSRIAGTLTIETVDDDLAIDSVAGSVRAAAGDDLSLRTDLRAGCSYEVRAGNDITYRIPSAASARVSLTAGGSIKAHRLETPIPAGNTVEFQLGSGEAFLSLTAGDDIVLTGSASMDDFTFEFGPDMGIRLEELAQRVAAQIESQVGSVAKQLDEKLANMGGTEEVASRIQERILAAARRAEEKITEAMRNVEIRTKESERRAAEAGQRGRGGFAGAPWPPPQPPKPPKPPRPPVSDEERLMILRMVSEGKISVEQAEKLLAALNG